MQYVGIQTQQSRNNRRSVLLLFLFPCLVAALLYLACYLLAAMGHGESMEVSILELANPLFINALPYTMGVVLIWFLIAFWANTSIIKAATGAKPLDRRENKRVYNLVENLCMANGMKAPKINIIDDDSLNAFASGINDRTYTVTLSKGIIQKLNDEELEAVIAHELTHIRNRDVRLLIVSIVFVGIFSMLTQITFYTITHTRIRSNGKKRWRSYPHHTDCLSNSRCRLLLCQSDALRHFTEARIYGRCRFGGDDKESVGIGKCPAQNFR